MWIILGGIFGLYALFVALDTFTPARVQSTVKLWRLRGLIGFVAYYSIAFYAPVIWDGVLAEHTLFDASGLPIWAQFLIGFIGKQQIPQPMQ